MNYTDFTGSCVVPLLYFVAAFGIVWAIGQWCLEMYASYREIYVEDVSSQHMDDMFLSLTPMQVTGLSQIFGVAFFLVMFALVGSAETTGKLAGTGAMALAFGGMGYAIPGSLIRRLRRKRLQLFNEQLVEAMQTMSNSLRAGFSVMQAFDMVVKENRRPISDEFGLFLHEHRLGMKFEEAMGNLSKRVGSQDLDLMITSIEIARQTGGNLTEVFDRLSNVIRERMRVEGKIQSLTAQGRLQAGIVGIMPLFLALAMYVISPQMMQGFFFSTTGVAIMMLGLGMEAVGYLIIRKIVSIDI